MKNLLNTVSPLALTLVAGLALGQNTDKVTCRDTTVSTSGNNGSTTAVHLNRSGEMAAFASTATDLVTGDTNTVSDVFVRDRRTNRTIRVSVPDPSMNQAQANNASYLTNVDGARVISDDGRFVVFTSSADNLVANDTNDVADIFVRDRDRDGNGIFDEAGVGKTRTTRVNLSSGENQAFGTCPNGVCDHYSWGATISADGRFVAFVTNAAMTADTASYSNVYVRDRDADNDGVFDETGGSPDAATTELVSKRIGSQYNGQQGDGYSDQPAISADGRYVAFMSRSKFMVFSDALDNDNDIYVRDLLTNTTAKMSLTTAGGHGSTADAAFPTISDNGRYVAFQSGDNDLVAGDSAWIDIFVRDRDTDNDGVLDEAGAVSTTQVSMGKNALPFPGGTVVPLSGHSAKPSISGDGRYVAFETEATNAEPGLIAIDTNEVKDIVVRDLVLALTKRVSLNRDNTQCEAASTNASMSGDGRGVAFISDGDNLDGGDTNTSLNKDGFVRTHLASDQAPTCAAAELLSQGQTVSGSTLGHGPDGSVTCGQSSNSPDVWYALTASCDGQISLDITWASFDTVLSVYAGCGGAEVACNDDNGLNAYSSVTFPATAGQTYAVRVGGYQLNAGWYTLEVSDCQSVPCPADYNQDGGIDGSDVEAFFADWEAGISGADVNADGGIDGADVEAFFAAWENGGCA